MAKLVARMMQMKAIMATLDSARVDNAVSQCPSCHGPLLLVNQAKLNVAYGDHQPLKWACATHANNKKACNGYLRRVDARAPFASPPLCNRGQVMTLGYSSTGRPWAWRCEHRDCRSIRWARGDVVA
jgi:hypothetical protein